MHNVTKRFYNDIVKDKIVIDAITRRKNGSLRMGARVMPIFKVPEPTTDKNEPLINELLERGRINPRKVPAEPGRMHPRDQNTMNTAGTLRELKSILDGDGDINEVNSLLKEMGYNCDVIIPFPLNPGLTPTTIGMRASDVFYTGKVPIIKDTGKVLSSDGTFSNDEFQFDGDANIVNALERIVGTLRSERYVNLSANKLSSGSFKVVSQELKRIIGVLSTIFKYNSSVYAFTDCSRILIDTISISFYRLEDMMTVFSTNKNTGVGFELFAFNSIEGQNGTFLNSGHCYIAHMIFATDAEGITQVDGEQLERGYQEVPSGELSMFLDRAVRCLPKEVNGSCEKVFEDINVFDELLKRGEF